MFRRTHARNFFFTWQSPDLQRWVAKHSYNSPVWIEQSDLRWVTQSICGLKPAEADKSRSTNELPIRVTLFNLKQLDTTAKWVAEPLTEYDCPPETNEHTSFATKRAYNKTMQFQLEQRAVIAGLMPTGDEQQDQKLPLQYFWITPKEAFGRKLKPKRSLPDSQREPFAILTKGRKLLFNADQFVEPSAIERYPISVASARPLFSHQHADAASWHEAHLATLASPEEQKLNWNKLCVFGTRKEYAEMGLALKADAVVVVVKAFASTSEYVKSHEENAGEKQASTNNSQENKEQEAWGAALKAPSDSDLVHYSLIANQDKLWEKSSVGRPDASASQEQKDQQQHVIVPQGVAVFDKTVRVILEYLEKHPEMKKDNKFWVTRFKVKSLGLQLIEGAEFVQTPRYVRDENTRQEYFDDKKRQMLEQREKETIDLIHISQCENPADAVSKIGMHTK